MVVEKYVTPNKFGPPLYRYCLIDYVHVAIVSLAQQLLPSQQLCAAGVLPSLFTFFCPLNFALHMKVGYLTVLFYLDKPYAKIDFN